MALSFARTGTDVILTYRTGKEEAEAVVNEIENGGRKAVALQLNMSDLKSLDAFVKEVTSARSSF
jgi:NAD(P)-dependent dehydrogenase (short-subunit alcohol dehydrogenase family)